MASNARRGRPGILPAIYFFSIQFFSAIFSATEFPHFCSFFVFVLQFAVKNGLHVLTLFDWGMLRRSRRVLIFLLNSCNMCIYSTNTYVVCVCCVFFPFILDINGRTSRGHTGGRSHIIHLLSAVHALIFLARRIQPFLSLVDREVEFCVLTILIVLNPWGIFIFVF